MKDMLSHKGYFGSIHYNHDDRIFYGKIEFIRALVSYAGKDADTLVGAFVEAVEDYLALCAEQGKDPEKPFKGSFNVRIAPELRNPAHGEHRFRSMPNTRSDGCRAPIPAPCRTL